MDLYESSAVARNVWDVSSLANETLSCVFQTLIIIQTADAHLRRTYGFSILDIVRRNPKNLTVYFGGRRGAAIRRNYQALEVCD